MTARSFRSAHLVVVAALAFGIAAAVQTIADRHSMRIDATPTGEASLAPATRRALSLLDGPIEATVYHGRDDLVGIREVLDRFEAASPRFRATLLALDRNPGRARTDGVERYGQAVIRHGGRSILASAARESSLAGALMELARGRPTHVLFVEGHGERELGDGTAPGGFGELRQALERERYRLAPWRPVSQEIPDGVGLVVLAGPEKDLLEPEAERLESFLDGGGRLLVLLDPGDLPNLGALLRRHGVDARPGIVHDGENRILGADPTLLAVPTFRPHAITRAQSSPAIFAIARPVAPAARGRGNASVLAESHAAAFASTATGRIPGSSTGPMPLAVAVSTTVAGGNESRLVVFGDADFASNGLLSLLGNRDLVLNAIAWAISAEDLVASRGGDGVQALRSISPLLLSAKQGRWLFLATVVIEPALVVALGAAVTIRRRRRG